MNEAIRRIVRESGTDLVEALSSRLNPTDFQSLLLEVYRLRAESVTPSHLLHQHEENRFVRPSLVSPKTMLELDRIAFGIAEPIFEPIELSPVCPLGTTSVTTSVSQNNIVPTARNTEVMADPTNVMALECAIRRKALLASKAERHGRIRLCCSHRVVRAQSLNQPKSWAHFRLFALCSSGRDEGSFRFEVEEAVSHINFHLGLISALAQEGYTIASTRVAVTNFGGDEYSKVHDAILEKLYPSRSSVTLSSNPYRSGGERYYHPVCFAIYASDGDGTEYMLADGGVTDWTQQLLSNKKERFVISGIGTERLCNVFCPTAKTPT